MASWIRCLTGSLVLGGATLSLLLGAGCPRPIDPQKVCLDVGVAIAAKTMECEGDAVEANERYETFAESHICLVQENNSADPRDLYACARNIRALDCALVADWADNLYLWLTTPGCIEVVALGRGDP